MTPAIAIRLAMLMGVLMFGGVTWFIRQSDPAPPFDPALMPALLWSARAVWGVALVVCFVLFGIMRNEREGPRARRLSVVGWALGEGVALFGGAVWFLTGTPAWYVPGLVFLVLTFLAFPIRRA